MQRERNPQIIAGLRQEVSSLQQRLHHVHLQHQHQQHQAGHGTQKVHLVCGDAS